MSIVFRWLHDAKVNIIQNKKLENRWIYVDKDALNEIGQYISKELCEPAVAKKLISKIAREINSLG